MDDVSTWMKARRGRYYTVAQIALYSRVPLATVVEALPRLRERGVIEAASVRLNGPYSSPVRWGVPLRVRLPWRKVRMVGSVGTAR